MTKKIITWVDLQGRYRVTSPAYNDQLRPADETEDDCLERVWLAIVTKGGYGIPIDHPHHYVEDADQKIKLAECCGDEFRYGKSGTDGAWEMDTDGTPKVNMAKARAVKMNRIRVVRDKELVKKDITFMRAVEDGNAEAQATIKTEKQNLRDIPQTFDITTGVDTPEQLKAKWPDGLPTE